MKKTLIIVCVYFASLMAYAQGWTPQSQNTNVEFRLLDCKYDGAKLAESKVITSDSKNWEVKQTVEPNAKGGETKYSFTFKAKRAMQDVGVAVAFDEYNWTSDNFVMIPSVVYNGNRQRIVNRDYATGGWLLTDYIYH